MSLGILLEQKLAECSVYERIPKDGSYRRKDEARRVEHPVINMSPTGHYLWAVVLG
jgi:hypothetical protein